VSAIKSLCYKRCSEIKTKFDDDDDNGDDDDDDDDMRSKIINICDISVKTALSNLSNGPLATVARVSSRSCRTLLVL